jgi:cytoskeletal protein RodZ
MIWFGVACAALLAVLVLVVIYGLFINKPETTRVSAAPTSTSKSSSATTRSKSTETPTESPTSVASAGAVTDGNFTFEVTGVETAPSVKYGDAPVAKTAQGEFLIVHMTVTDTGAMSATFLGTLQKLKAGGTKDVAIAFDVPPGTTPDSIELHGDPISSGVEVPLS